MKERNFRINIHFTGETGIILWVTKSSFYPTGIFFCSITFFHIFEGSGDTVGRARSHFQNKKEGGKERKKKSLEKRKHVEK
jgi:hypothetical protein